jgi:hypothetical protein
MLWILENTFSQDWSFKPSCFYKCSQDDDKNQMERLDIYALKEVGDDPARYGYVKIEGESEDEEDNLSMIAFCCDSREEMEFVYDRIADALLHHPGVIDLRGKYKIRII